MITTDSRHDSGSDPLRSVHTASFPHLLSHLNAAVFVTTYQAGKLVMLRNDQGVLNTHFRSFSKPMGLAASRGKLAIGCHVDIWEFHNVPAVCPKLDEVDSHRKDGRKSRHDACFMPRRSHFTGDVQIHEMSWVQDELIFVNTVFSCLARRSDQNSFEPVWRPKFIRQYVPGDNCHLNGLAADHDRLRFVTALSETDSPGGWRENKRDGGIVINVESNAIVARNLSMPHSPRWHENRLWVLESGKGSLGFINFSTGSYETVATLPGFTRGLCFVGSLAFVGLSQVRESAVFSGIPLVDQVKDRTCGVWIINTLNGETLGFCRFEEGVQEIFSVEVSIGIEFPDLVTHDDELVRHAYVLGDDALADVPPELRA